MSVLGHRWWLLLLMLIFLLLLFHQFSGLLSPRLSPCRPPQPRREIQTDEEKEGYEAWNREQMKRKIRVKKFCNKETEWKDTWLNDPNIHPLMFQYNAEHSLMGCLQPKVASTTWHQHFYCLESETRREEIGLLPREEQADLLSAPSDPDVETLASTSVSFSMVRHPFERLVSAYQDKIANNPEGHLRLWKGVYKMIESQYGDKTFPSFVKWLVGWKEVHEDLCPDPDEDTPVACEMNPHWSQLQDRCFYCALTYKVIAKFETFQEDLRYIGYLANVTFNEGVRENHTGKTTSLRALKFFRQLTQGEVGALYNLYREDFLMFGYSALPYKAVARK